MHSVTAKIRHKVHALKADAGTKAGILKIFEHSGKLKTLSELRELTERERDWFAKGFEEYLEDHEHPVRAIHAPIHYGRVVYFLSLLYFLSLVTWLMSIVNISVEEQRAIHWPAVLGWLALVIVFNLALTAYGMYLEVLGLKNRLHPSQRIMAFAAMIVLIIAIVGNMLAPYTLHSTPAGAHLFVENSEL